MKLKIITTQRTVEYDVDWVELSTPAGNIVIQEHHAPLIIELMQGQELIYQLTNKNIESIIVVQGVAHVTRQEVKILLPMDL